MRMNPAKIVGLVRFLHRTENLKPQRAQRTSAEGTEKAVTARFAE
jgi:hypothetical protein